jgi:hypothetical protein
MYRIYGTGYAGSRPIPTAVDYTVQAKNRHEALEKVRQMGIVVVHYTIKHVR